MAGRLSAMNFSFVVPGVLAGCALPRACGSDEGDLMLLGSQGVVGLVSLTENPLDESVVVDAGLAYLHVPIRDFGEPTLLDIRTVIEFVRNVTAAKKGPVAIHCGSGYGRTGTLLACYLVSEGTPPAQAIAEVRRLRPGSVETRGQEAVVDRWDRSLHSS
jgi:atypical dual specificity phosphatase